MRLNSNKILWTTLVFFLFFYLISLAHADNDCGFNGIKDRIQRSINAKKYWDQEIDTLNGLVEQVEGEIQLLYLDIRELSHGHFVGMRIRRAIIEAKTYGVNLEEARQYEIDSIKEERELALELLQLEKEILEDYNKCLEEAQNALDKTK